MGNTSYSSNLRTVRVSSLGYHSKPVNDIFTQNRVRQIHALMDPANIVIREARDSSVHPNTVPILLGLDVTGSMGHVSHDLIKDGLPNLVGGIIQKGILDPALLFVAIGDHECDSYPLQVAQFESGDAELDGWLTKTYIEGGGGGNRGESYLLAWYLAAYHTVTDALEKRNQKGFLFTVGDEPCLPLLPLKALKRLMVHAVGQSDYTVEALLKAAQEKYNVYHLHVTQGNNGRDMWPPWRTLLGQNLIEVEDFRDIPNIISKIVVDNTTIVDNSQSVSVSDNKPETEILL